MPRLIVEKGADKGKVIRLPKSGPLVVGRDPKAGFRLSDANISRLHFQIEARDEAFVVSDLKSMNGTYLNGSRLQEDIRLSFSDKIQIGETHLSFLEDEVKGDKAELLGKTLQGYQVEQRLGRGGMGTVYRALQLSLHRTVALKILSPELVKDSDFVALFEQEAHAAAALNHPNIVQVYDFGKAENLYFFSMEYLPGGSVQDLLSREKRLTPKKAVAIALDALKGLEYAEKKKIVHRDIKPDNLMIGEEDAIKIGDLGLAKSLKEGPAAPENGTILGTPHYVAPEQALGKPIDPRVDIYALGATLYRIVAGTTPYHGNTVKEILIRKVKEEPKKLKEIDAELPENLCALIERMMAKDPEQRPQSASQILPEMQVIRDELEGRTTSYPLPARDTSVSLTVATPPGTSESRPRAALIAVALLLAIAFAAGGFFAVRSWLRKPVDPTPPVNNAPDGTLRAYSELLLNNARAADPREETIAAYDKAIREYQKVIDEAAGTPAAAEAGKRITQLKKGRAKIEADLALQTREAQAWTELEQALTELERVRAGCLADLKLGPVNAEIARVKDLIEKHKNTKAAQRATEQVEAAAGWMSRVVPRLLDVRRAITEARGLVEGGRFSEAIPAVQKLQREKDDPQVVKEVGEAVLSLQRQEEEYRRKAGLRARDLADQGKFAEALQVLADLEKCLYTSELMKTVRVQQKLIAEQQEETRIHQEEERKRAEQARLELAHVKAILATARPAFDYATAVKLLEEASATLTVPELQQAASRTLAGYRLEGAAWKSFVERADPNAPKERNLRNRQISVASFTWLIDGVVGDQLMARDPKATGARIGLKLTAIPHDVLYQALANGWSQNTAEVAGILCFGARRGVPSTSMGDLFKKAKSSDEAEWKLAEEIKQDPAQRHLKEASMLYRFALASERGKSADATRAYRVLKDQFSTCSLYDNWSAQIDKWLATHRED